MQKKKLLVAYFGDTPECVEGFPKGCVRSCEGSLMFRRGKKRTITEDEYDFIKKNYSHMTKKLRLIAQTLDKPKKVESKKGDSKKDESKKDAKETQSGEEGSSSSEQSGSKPNKKKAKTNRRR